MNNCVNYTCQYLHISLWSLRVSSVDYFCRINISRLSLRPSNNEQFRSSMNGRAPCYSPWNRSNGASLRLGPIESNLHVRSLVHPQTSSIAKRLREWFASTGVYSCSHLLNCDAFMTACRWELDAEAKKKNRLLLRRLSYFEVCCPVRSRRDSNIHLLCSVIRCVQKRRTGEENNVLSNTFDLIRHANSDWLFWFRRPLMQLHAGLYGHDSALLRN